MSRLSVIRSSFSVALPGIIALIAAGLSHAGNATLSAAQIVDKNAAARGGLSNWRAVQTLAVSGKMDLGKPSVPTPKDIEVAHRGSPTLRKSLADAGLRRNAAVAGTSAGSASTESKTVQPVILPFVMEMKRPHKTRLEIVYDKDTSVQTFDGISGWKLRPYLGRKDALPFTPEELKEASAQADLDGMLIDSTAKGYKVAFEKIEPLAGRDQYRLRVTLKNHESREVWVDAQTFLETRVDNKPRRVEGRMRSASTYYSDYRATNGLMIPHVVETRVDGTTNAGKLLVEEVRVNPPLDDARFTKPK